MSERTVMYGLQHSIQKMLHILSGDIIFRPILYLICQISNKTGLLRQHQFTNFRGALFCRLMVVVVALAISPSHPLIHNACSQARPEK
ncbi:hypothetical protein FQZ97_944630 [compost metagenome]